MVRALLVILTTFFFTLSANAGSGERYATLKLRIAEAASGTVEIKGSVEFKAQDVALSGLALTNFTIWQDGVSASSPRSQKGDSRGVSVAKSPIQFVHGWVALPSQADSLWIGRQIDGSADAYTVEIGLIKLENVSKFLMEMEPIGYDLKISLGDVNSGISRSIPEGIMYFPVKSIEVVVDSGDVSVKTSQNLEEITPGIFAWEGLNSGDMKSFSISISVHPPADKIIFLLVVIASAFIVGAGIGNVVRRVDKRSLKIEWKSQLSMCCIILFLSFISFMFGFLSLPTFCLGLVVSLGVLVPPSVSKIWNGVTP